MHPKIQMKGVCETGTDGSPLNGVQTIKRGNKEETGLWVDGFKQGEFYSIETQTEQDHSVCEIIIETWACYQKGVMDGNFTEIITSEKSYHTLINVTKTEGKYTNGLFTGTSELTVDTKEPEIKSYANGELMNPQGSKIASHPISPAGEPLTRETVRAPLSH